MTDNIINLEESIKIKNHGQHCKMQMPDGSWWFKYSASYTYHDEKGRSSGIPENLLENSNLKFPVDEWSIDFWARNDEDALKKVEAMKASLQTPTAIVDYV